MQDTSIHRSFTEKNKQTPGFEELNLNKAQTELKAKKKLNLSVRFRSQVSEVEI